MNYLYKPPPTDEYYHEEESYAVNKETRVSDKTPNAPIRKIGTKVNKTKVETMVITTDRVIISDMGITNGENNFNRGIYGNRNDRSGPYVPPQNHKVSRGDGGGNMA